MSKDVSVADMGAAWLQWIDTVPEAEREIISDVISQYDSSSYEGMMMLQHAIMKALLAGRLSAAVIPAVMAVMKEMQTTLFMVHKYQKQPEQAGVAMLRHQTTELLQAIKPVQARFVTSNRDQLSLPDSVVDEELVPMRDVVDAAE